MSLQPGACPCSGLHCQLGRASAVLGLALPQHALPHAHSLRLQHAPAKVSRNSIVADLSGRMVYMAFLFWNDVHISGHEYWQSGCRSLLRKAQNDVSVQHHCNLWCCPGLDFRQETCNKQRALMISTATLDTDKVMCSRTAFR